MSTRLKVCGITRAEDLASCERAGVDAIGLNLWPGSKRYVTPVAARTILEEGWSAALRVGVFVDPDPSALAEIQRTLALDLVQLHGNAPVQSYASLGLPYVWVIRGTPRLDRLVVPRPEPAWILLDSVVPGFGGAGEVTDWAWARAAVEHLRPLAVWLAGGINPDNAAEAIDAVAPAGLDVASGGELDTAIAGEKDPTKIATLVGICHKGGSP